MKLHKQHLSHTQIHTCSTHIHGYCDTLPPSPSSCNYSILPFLPSSLQSASTLEASSHSSSTAQLIICYPADKVLFFFAPPPNIFLENQIPSNKIVLSPFAIVSIVLNCITLGFNFLAFWGRSLEHWFSLFYWFAFHFLLLLKYSWFTVLC